MITKTNALFFLRHCKTVNNVKDIITGCKEVAVLSDQKVYKDNLTFQKKMTILCSPLSRCKETVELLTPNLNFVPNIVICDELTERSMGELEGMERCVAVDKYPELFYDKKFIYDMTPPNGENYLQICKRVDWFINNVLREYLQKGDVMLCSHNHILKIIYFKMTNISIEENWYTTKFANGKIYKIFD